jgi:hypothetical protein
MFALLIGYVVPWPMVERAGAMVGWYIAQPAAGLVLALIFRRGRSVDFA